jgi:hypothetical protein
MGFFKKVLSAFDDSVRFLSNPSKVLAMVEDIHRPSGKLDLNSVFVKADGFLDIVSPSHNAVQTWSTGQSTTAGQSPYFQQIAPIILDFFLPGAGSMARGVDGASNGKTTQAIMGVAGGVAGMSGWTDYSVLGVDGKTIGTVASMAGKGYAIYDAAGNLKGYQGVTMPNSVSDIQQGIPAYSSTFAGQPYGNLIGATGPGTNEAANAIIANAEKQASDRKILVIAAAAAVALYLSRSA